MLKEEVAQNFRIDFDSGFYLLKRIYHLPVYKERTLNRFVTRHAANEQLKKVTGVKL